MFDRTSKNYGNHIDSDYKYPEYAKLTEAEKIFKYRELEKNVIDCPSITPEQRVNSQRAILKLLHFYPLVKDIKFEFLQPYPQRSQFAQTLAMNSKISTYTNRKDMLLDDVRHIEKLMMRYHVDFDKAFDFFMFNNALRTDLKYRGASQKKIYEVVDKMTRTQLIVTANKAFISEDRLNGIIPLLMEKMTRSEYESVEAKYQNTLFKNTDTGVFSEAARMHIRDLDACVEKYKKIGLSLTK